MPTHFIIMDKNLNSTLNPQFRKFLKTLGEYKIPYLIVGGYAVAVHGYVRATGDLDIWIRQDEETADKMLLVMMAFGFSPYDFQKEDFLPDETGKAGFVFIGEEPIKIDILGDVAGLNFDTCYQQRNDIEIEGLTLSFINFKDLIISKKAANRLKDQQDLENLLDN